MLYLSGNDPIRVQCAFVDTPEVDDINKFIADQQGYLEPFELPEPQMESDEFGLDDNDADLSHLDPMFEDAARLIISSQQGSTSLIQRKFSIGYNRAGRLMDQLEKAGIVGAAHGSKPREVLIQDEMSLDNLLHSLRYSE
jgi:S-DNA-T family DNA segregation ATPase FtsK/SpoIIIE